MTRAETFSASTAASGSPELLARPVKGVESVLVVDVLPRFGELSVAGRRYETDSRFECRAMPLAAVDVEDSGVVLALESVQQFEAECAGLAGDDPERGKDIPAADVGAGGRLTATGAVPADVGVHQRRGGINVAVLEGRHRLDEHVDCVRGVRCRHVLHHEVSPPSAG